MRSRLALLLLVVLCLFVAGTAGARLERLSGNRLQESQLLYLPNGNHLRVASLGQQSMLADLVYLWAIQFYANYERADRYRYVEHVFGEVITELDPNYVDAYWMGALIMTLEAHDLEAGLRLLDKGYELNPDEWVLPYLAGWECRFAGQFVRAAGYFRRAAEVPGAPAHVRRMVAGMYKLAGDVREALALWRAVLEDPGSDPASKAIAERQVRDLHIRADIEDLTEAVGAFRYDNGTYPARLDELVSRGYVATLPLDPDGNPYDYDAPSGTVSSVAGRILR